MPSAPVFISYRRDDAAGYARAVYDELAQHFGAQRVFIDVDDIAAGQPFGEVIERQVLASQVVLVLIGPRWQGERAGAPPRLHDASDLVRREVAAGLASGARVIPVLLDGAAMPGASQLPDELRALAGRNALELGNSRYAADMARLVTAVRDTLGDPPAAESGPTAGAAVGLGRWRLGAVIAVVAAAALLWWPMNPPPGTAARDDRVAAASDSAASPVALRPDINGLWQADVRYDWPNADYVERFEFHGEANELRGTASFLRVPRRVIDAHVDTDGVRFSTLTNETMGSSSADIVHRYEGHFNGSEQGGEIRFVMQTEGGSSAHAPVEFVARRSAAAAAAVSATAGR